ncbi:hypothetical protein YPPY11_3478, partial [Yersinia pestis PY-11]
MAHPVLIAVFSRRITFRRQAIISRQTIISRHINLSGTFAAGGF